MDSSSLFRPGGTNYLLEPIHAGQVLEKVLVFAKVPDRARRVSLADGAGEDSTLNITHFVLAPLGGAVPPLNTAIADFQTAWEKAQEAEEKFR